jgi:hypothetical protein
MNRKEFCGITGAGGLIGLIIGRGSIRTIGAGINLAEFMVDKVTKSLDNE